eukprot:EG_transcript_47027
MYSAFQQLWFDALKAKQEQRPEFYADRLQAACCVLEGLRAQHHADPVVRHCCGALQDELLEAAGAVHSGPSLLAPGAPLFDGPGLDFNEVLALPCFSALLSPSLLTAVEEDSQPAAKRMRLAAPYPAGDAP